MSEFKIVKKGNDPKEQEGSLELPEEEEEDA